MDSICIVYDVQIRTFIDCAPGVAGLLSQAGLAGSTAAISPPKNNHKTLKFSLMCIPLASFFGQRFRWVFIELGKTVGDTTFWTGVYNAPDRSTNPKKQNGKYKNS